MSKPKTQVTDTTVKKNKLDNLKPFKAGEEWSGNKRGRPKGSRNKLNEDFISALQADFSVNGVKVIEKVRTERPHEYLKVIAGILPKEVNVSTTAVEELSDDELTSALAALRSLLVATAAREGSGPQTIN